MTRRLLEGAAVLLAFPLAVALTAVAIAPSSSSSSSPVSPVAVAFDGGGLEVSLAGPDAVAAYAIADKLTAGGYDLEAVSVASGEPEKSLSAATVVVYYERGRRGAALRLRDLLGNGTIRLEHVLEPGSDLTVLLGKDPQRT